MRGSEEMRIVSNSGVKLVYKICVVAKKLSGSVSERQVFEED